MKINSVLGQTTTETMGVTLMHEHVACYDWSMRMSFGKRWMDAEALVPYVGEWLKEAKEKYGLKTVVDGSAANIGRDIHLIQAVAAYSGVDIIVSSGLYFNEEPFLVGKPASEIARVLIDECEHGIEDTDIKPGILKCATDVGGVTPINHMILEAVSETHCKTGLPIFAHSAPLVRTGLVQMAVLKDNGVDLTKVIIGHSGDTNDLEYLERLLKNGCYIGMDRIGTGNGTNSLENRMETIYQLCRRGWIDRLILAHDNCPFIDWGPFNWELMGRPENPWHGVDFTYIHREAVPVLLKKGLTQSDIDHMLIDNPRNFFEG